MTPEMRQRILAHNKRVQEQRKKSEDLEDLVRGLKKLPLVQQLVNLLSDEVKEILKKYGFED